MHDDPPGHELTDRAFTMLDEYRETNDLPVLHRAIALFRRAATAAHHPDRAARLSDLGAALQTLYEHGEDPDVLAEAVAVGRAAVAGAGEQHPDRPLFLSNLSLVLLSRYDQDDDPSALDEAISCAREAAAAHHPDRARYAGSLADALLCRYERVGDLGDLREAADAGRLAVDACSSDDPDLCDYLCDLGLTLRSLHERSGDLAVLVEAARHGRAACRTAAPGDPRLARLLGNAAGTVLELHEWTGEAAHLREAVRTGRRAAKAAQHSPAEQGGVLVTLCAALHATYESDGDVAALDESVLVGRSAVALTAGDPALHPEALTNLGLALQTRYLRHGGAPLLQEAISLQRRAVEVVARDWERVGYLANLYHALRSEYERSADPEALAEAVEVAREAVVSTPSDSPHLAGRLSNLAGGLQTTYQVNGDLGVLDEAVQTALRVVRITAEDDPNRAGRLSNFCAALRMLYERSQHRGVWRDAVEAGRQAVRITPVDHPERAMRLSTLAAAIRAGYTEVEDRSLIDEAVAFAGEAVACTPPTHADRAGRLEALSWSLQTLDQVEPDLATLAEAMSTAEHAVDATEPEGPHRAMSLTALATAARTWFSRTGERAALEYSRSRFAEAAVSTSAPLVVRASALLSAARSDLYADDADHAVAMVEQLAELLPQVMPPGLSRADRQERLVGLPGLASTAAAAMVAAGEPERAVELLEKTRGVLFADELDTRGDLSALRLRSPALAAAFDDLREAISRADHLPVTAQDHRTAVELRTGLRNRWKALMTEIREVPGLEDFLRPPRIDQLRQAAAEGPIVYVVVHGERGHALIVTGEPGSPVEVVDLDGLAEAAATQQAVELYNALRAALDRSSAQSARTGGQQRISEVLGWLWEAVAEPVLRRLGRTTTPLGGQQWPRVWWCPVGVMAFLPLHAAGRHSRQPGTDAVMDRVISSYTPTARALIHAREAGSPGHDDGPPAVIVAVPDAPRARPLRGARREAALLRKLIPGATLLPEPGTTTDRESVIAALRTHRIAHFACHCVANVANPGWSRLVLHDHLDAPLTVSTISALRLTGGELAVLSACDTTSTSPSHADEATHLTAAFHLAGYRTVVGTLWSVNDTAAAAVAYGFYSRLTRHGTATPDPSTAAAALHHVIRGHRTDAPDLPTRWAAHVHVGR